MNTICSFRGNDEPQKLHYTVNKFEIKLSDPISKDTVSFHGTRSARKAKKAAKTLWEEAALELAKAKRYSDKTVTADGEKRKMSRTSMRNLLAQEEENHKDVKHYIITLAKGLDVEVHDRLKSLDSAINKTKNEKYKLNSAKDVREKMYDLHGTKYVTHLNSTNELEKYADRLIKDIKSGKIELVEVENKRPGIVRNFPEEIQSKFDLMRFEILNKLIDAQNQIYKSKIT